MPQHHDKPRIKYDELYKQFFSQPAAVKALLTEYVDEDWIKDLDFTALERVNSSYISKDLRERRSDVIWKLPLRGESELYVCLLLEFQSSIDHFMAVRVLNYLTLLYLDLIAQKRTLPGRKLPPVLPIVLYNGERRWHAPTNICDLITQPSDRGFRWLPQMRYCLIDEGAIVSNDDLSSGIRNVVKGLFRVEFAEDMRTFDAVARLLIECVQTPEYETLRPIIAAFLRQIMLSADWTDEESKAMWEQADELEEVQTMIAERIQNWQKQLRQEGIEQGREQGIEQGRKQGIEQGIEKGLLRAVEGMVRCTQLSDKEIADITGLPIEQICALRDSLT